MRKKRTTMAAMAYPAPCTNLVSSTTTSTIPDIVAPMALMTRLRCIRVRSARSRSRRRCRFQWRIMPVWLSGNEDAVAEGELVAAGVRVAGQVAVLGQDRAEEREAVERGVGREDEDEAGDDGHDDHARVEAGEEGRGDLPHDRVLDVAVVDRL